MPSLNCTLNNCTTLHYAVHHSAFRYSHTDTVNTRNINHIPIGYQPYTHYIASSVPPCVTLLATSGLLLKLSRVGPGQFLDGRPDAARSSGLKKISQCPRAVIGDTALCRVPSFGWDVKRVARLSEVIKDPMALIVRVGVLTPVSLLNSQSGPQTITVT